MESERVGGDEHNACIVHSLTRELFGKIAVPAQRIDCGLHGNPREVASEDLVTSGWPAVTTMTHCR